MNLKMIAWKMGVSVSTAYRWLKEDKGIIIQRISEQEVRPFNRRQCDHCGRTHLYYDNRCCYCIARLGKAYGNMLGRCYDPRTNRYKYYGGRGIQVCPEWRNDKNTFKHWALNNGYQDNLTIDRIDNDKGYSPENCQWIKWKANNKKAKRGKK